MLNNIKTVKDSRGFTIVELLIVIVVIAILAAITIVAYNGIQNRANDTTAQETANQIRTKIEAYNSVEGIYPPVTGGTPNMGTVKEAEIETNMTSKLAGTIGGISKTTPVFVAQCPATGTATGAKISYFKTTGGPGVYTLGTGTCA